jgi:hypothetical protein
MYKKSSIKDVSKRIAAFKRKQRQAEDAAIDVANAIIQHVMPIIKPKKTYGKESLCFPIR